MAANMEIRPKPAAPIRDYSRFTLVIRCEGCERYAHLRFRRVTRGRLPDRFSDLERRLRCRRGEAPCGSQGRILDVRDWRY